jgi:glycosyltransferase involved in cell wall biosynthesis
MLLRNSERAFQICEIEITRELPETRLSDRCSGVAFVVRRKGRPIGFLLHTAKPGSRITAKELASLIVRRLGARILEESIYEELVPKPDCSGFPPLTIAICTRNRTAELRRCIRSIQEMLSQHSGFAGRVEILVVDNAPDDKSTRTVVAQFLNARYVLEKKPGLDFARNRAIQEATGELLAFIDDDAVVDRFWMEGLIEAWAANPDASAFTGPVLPYELETRAQITFEEIGGFGHNFNRVRFGREQADSSSYPCGAGMFGCGCNMVFRRETLIELGGFDDALDTGAPLPGGGDLDIFYRVVRAGYPLVSEPKLMVFHQHRRDYAKLRHQMWTWGLGSMAYVSKSYQTDPSQRATIRRWIWWWAAYQFSKIFVPFLRRSRKPWPVDLVVAEIAGGVVGLMGEYRRSLKRMEIRRRLYS